MWPYDPEYVKQQLAEDFDPHLDLSQFAGAMTAQQVQDYKDGDHTLKPLRHLYKTVNYAATYGIGKVKLSKTLDISQNEAAKIIKAFWDRNWAIKEIAKSCKVIKVESQKWLMNPINNFWYSLRSEKDRFSTLNQSSGDYSFTLWIKFILEENQDLIGQFHDEIILDIREDQKEEIEKLLKKCINKVNKVLNLNRDLDVDIQFGRDYSQIH